MIAVLVLFVIFTGARADIYYENELTKTDLQTQFGTIKGLVLSLPNNTGLSKVDAYLGIQYASLLGSDMRFMPAAGPSERWSGVRVGIRFRPPCEQKLPDLDKLRSQMPHDSWQIIDKILSQFKPPSEDCLSLNIYRPQRPKQDLSNATRFAVMLFVHGSSFDWGSGNSYNPAALVSHGGIIVITLNYRVGPLGFLGSKRTRSGNYAVLDIIAALQWVKENIDAFHGDPNRITIAGHGHGAALVNLVLLSPITKDYAFFHRAILQSGSATAPWAVSYNPEMYMSEILEKTNCTYAMAGLQGPRPETKDLYACLKSRTAKSIAQATPEDVPKYLSGCAPVVDTNVVTDPVDKLLEDSSSQFAKIPILLGTVDSEAYHLMKPEWIDKGITEQERRRILRTYVRNTFTWQRQKIYDILDYGYKDWIYPDTNKSRRDAIIQLLTDGQYVAPLLKVAQAHAETGANTFLYAMEISSRFDSSPQWPGTAHGDDLAYLFGVPVIDGVTPYPRKQDGHIYRAEDKMYSETVMTYWANFVKSGNPNIPVRLYSLYPSLGNRQWPRYDNIAKQYMNFAERPQVKTGYKGKQAALWLELIPRIHVSNGLPLDQHQLSDPNNKASYEGQTREDNRPLFPPPPSPPTPPPPFRDLPRSDQQDPTVKRDSDNRESEEKETTQTYIVIPQPTPSKTEASQAETASNLGLPISIAVAVAGALIFLNVLICAAVYYHKEKMRKQRRHARSKMKAKAIKKNETEPIPQPNHIPNGSPLMANETSTPLVLSTGPQTRTIILTSGAEADYIANQVTYTPKHQTPSTTGTTLISSPAPGPGQYSVTPIGSKRSLYSTVTAPTSYGTNGKHPANTSSSGRYTNSPANSQVPLSTRSHRRGHGRSGMSPGQPRSAGGPSEGYWSSGPSQAYSDEDDSSAPGAKSSDDRSRHHSNYGTEGRRRGHTSDTDYMSTGPQRYGKPTPPTRGGSPRKTPRSQRPDYSPHHRKSSRNSDRERVFSDSETRLLNHNEGIVPTNPYHSGTSHDESPCQGRASPPTRSISGSSNPRHPIHYETAIGNVHNLHPPTLKNDIMTQSDSSASASAASSQLPYKLPSTGAASQSHYDARHPSMNTFKHGAAMSNSASSHTMSGSIATTDVDDNITVVECIAEGRTSQV